MTAPANSTPQLVPLPPANSIDLVRKTHTEELVIALCGPMGSPVHLIAEKLSQLLTTQYQYKCSIIKLSKFIEEKCGNVAVGASRFERKKELIEKGNKLRFDHGSGVLAELAISEISFSRNVRREKNNAERFEPSRVCHIIDSIKNQNELDVLRTVYRDMLFCIGVLSPVEFREKNLRRQDQMSLSEVYDLIDQDSGEEFEHGQTVRQTFPQADFFLRVDSMIDHAVEGKIKRFLNIVLNTDVITPTAGERAMFAAASAATNSACLSRQVGAAVTDNDGEVLSVGWNDVPKAGGNLYSGNLDSVLDYRCANLEGGTCFNDQHKARIVGEIVNALISENVLDKNKQELAMGLISKSKVKDLIEFSRSIHAEMHAIITGSQKSGGGATFFL